MLHDPSQIIEAVQRLTVPYRLGHLHSCYSYYPVKILVIEDQRMVREMLVLACTEAVPSAVVSDAADGASGLARCRQMNPDLIILDLELPDCDGLSLVKDFFECTASVRIIVLSSHTDEFTVHRALRANVHGFVDKKEQPVKIIAEAMKAVMAGEQYLSSLVQRARASLRADPSAFNKLLSDREQELLGLLGLGLSNDEACKLLHLSAHTVKNHRRNIMAKLGIHGTPRLIRYADEKGFTRVALRTHRLSGSAP
ncbi:MAG TPA: response regulator transcription factor [Opitutaceae bacterium]|nr:response regulator transcription factor [Opitutaceae bacterium]